VEDGIQEVRLSPILVKNLKPEDMGAAGNKLKIGEDDINVKRGLMGRILYGSAPGRRKKL